MDPIPKTYSLDPHPIGRNNVEPASQENGSALISTVALGAFIAFAAVCAAHLKYGIPKARIWLQLAAGVGVISFYIHWIFRVSTSVQQPQPALPPPAPIPEPLPPPAPLDHLLPVSLETRTVDLRKREYDDELELWEQTDQYILNTDGMNYHSKQKAINDFTIELTIKMNLLPMIQNKEHQRIAHANHLLKPLQNGAHHSTDFPRVSIVGDHILVRPMRTENGERAVELAHTINSTTNVGVEVRYCGSSNTFKTFGLCERNELDDLKQMIDQVREGESITVDLKLEDTNLTKLFTYALDKKVFLNFKLCKLNFDGRLNPQQYSSYHSAVFNIARHFLEAAVNHSVFMNYREWVIKQFDLLASRFQEQVIVQPIQLVIPPAAAPSGPSVIVIRVMEGANSLATGRMYQQIANSAQLAIHFYQFNFINEQINTTPGPQINPQ